MPLGSFPSSAHPVGRDGKALRIRVKHGKSVEECQRGKILGPLNEASCLELAVGRLGFSRMMQSSDGSEL
jgi:hypothetical protein